MVVLKLNGIIKFETLNTLTYQLKLKTIMDRNLLSLVDQVTTDWKDILTNPYLPDVVSQLKEKTKPIDGLAIYPSPEMTFRAFNYQDIKNTKVVIIGQDCYHGPGQAIGLCFGVENQKPPPSLVNINRELTSDIGNPLSDYSLDSWAQQGVLLLNSALTVQKSLAGSHLKCWTKYTDYLIKQFSSQTNKVVFLLWGNYAKSKKALISDDRDHLVLTANHPSPLSANRGGWFGCQHFSKTNQYLTDNGLTPIKFS